MLKTHRDNHTWLVSQPDHGGVAGYLAAHWGNDQFAAPGHFAHAHDPEQLCAETVLAIAEHDNGWWEWEAIPELGDLDDLPLDLAEVLKNQQEGMDRWQRGIPRFSEEHPYVSLLISFHAYWLYAARSKPDPDPAFLHPLFWKRAPEKLVGGSIDEARKFVADLEAQQADFSARLRGNPVTAMWVDPENLKPNVRLLQLLDGLSLSLCSPHIPPLSGEAKGLGEHPFDLLEVPRGSWLDRVTIEVRPAGARRIALKPYPFDVDPLRVVVPVRIIDSATRRSGAFHRWWHSQQAQWIQFEFCAA